MGYAAKKSIISAVLPALIIFCTLSHAYASGTSIYMEDLTWMEISSRIQSGATTVIVPTGGIAQSGPQIVTGRHNAVVRYAAAQIAHKLGNVLVAPVITYTPEGRINPPEGHMQFPGTISVSEQTFGALLEDTARSLKAQGFKLICFMGDSSGSQVAQRQIADKLNSYWQEEGVHVLQVSDYYSHNGQEKWNGSVGVKVKDPGAYAGMVDTSEMMAVDQLSVRKGLLAAHSERDYKATGAAGDSTLASVAYGRRYLGLKINAAAKQIQDAQAGIVE